MNGKLVIPLLTLLGVGSQYALAQDYPARTIRLVVPTSPGGSSDILGRVLAQKLGEALGQQVVVDNRAGASSVIGTDLAAKSAPDGYTLLIAPAALAINPSMFSKLPYDTMRDLAPISRIAEAPNLLVCVTGKKRIQALPGLPTIAEAGLPGYEAMQWYGVLAPAGTPRPIIDRLYQEISRAMRAPDMKERLMADGTDAVASTPEEFATYLESETGKWAKVIREAGIKPL